MRLFKQLGEDVQDIYTTFTTLILATPVLLIIVYLAFVMLTSCKGWEVRFQGDLNEERWEARQQER
tara:strand:- start:265 stop:462 length:198 start_codon:yes stop_codon:yes gene_type:complete